MTGYSNSYMPQENLHLAAPVPHNDAYSSETGRRLSYSPTPPPQMGHDGDIVVFPDSKVPSSPLSSKSSGHSADVSMAMTDVSMPSYSEYDPKPGYEGALVVRTESEHGMSAKNPSGLPSEILKMKKNRRRYTVGAGVVGGVVGLVALGPVGAVFGGVGSAVATKQINKRREKKKLEKLSDREIARQHVNAPDVNVHSGEFL